MRPGDILRQRNIRVYGEDPRNYFEFVPDREKAKDLKRVFVMMLLGTEAFELLDSKGDQKMSPLNVDRSMNSLGWWHESQLREALGSTRGASVLKKVRDWSEKKLKQLIESRKDK